MAFMGKKPAPAHAEEGQPGAVRTMKTSPLVFAGTVIILVIVIVAFVFVPALVPEAGGGGGDLNFGAYNKIPVSYVAGNYFARIQGMYAQFLQSQITDSNYYSVLHQIWRGAFEETVVHTGMLDAVQRAGYTPSNDLIDRETALRPEFQGENGRFSPVRYQQYDSSARLAIWREVRDTIIEQQYRSDIGGLLVSSKEGDFIAGMASPERTFELAAFSRSLYPDSEVQAYASASPDTFLTTHLYKITINSSEREARQILALIQDGTQSFEDAASAYSKDAYAEKGGDMGIRMAYELVSEIPDTAERGAVLKLSSGAYSELVKVPSGWAFFRCGETAYAPNIADADTLTKIRSYMEAFERGRIEDWLIGQAEEFTALVRASSFDEAAEAQGLIKRNFGPLPLNYGDSDLFTSLGSFSVPELGGAAVNDNFWRTAFSTPPGSLSAPFVHGGYVMVIQPVEEKAASEEQRESVKQSVSSYWLSNNTEAGLRAFFLSSPKLEDRFTSTFNRFFLQVQ